MKTIEERAAEYEEISGCYGCELAQVKQAFIAGAQSEHEELTRWNTPNELPENARDVLVKFRDAITYNERYAIGFFADGWWHSRTFNSYNEILGWRDIYEP